MVTNVQVELVTYVMQLFFDGAGTLQGNAASISAVAQNLSLNENARTRFNRRLRLVN